MRERLVTVNGRLFYLNYDSLVKELGEDSARALWELTEEDSRFPSVGVIPEDRLNLLAVCLDEVLGKLRNIEEPEEPLRFPEVKINLVNMEEALAFPEVKTYFLLEEALGKLRNLEGS